MASSREIEGECQCCRHFTHDEEECSRCVACGEWCEECGEIALLHDSGLCEDCCHRGGCECGDDDEDDAEVCEVCGADEVTCAVECKTSPCCCGR